MNEHLNRSVKIHTANRAGTEIEAKELGAVAEKAAAHHIPGSALAFKAPDGETYYFDAKTRFFNVKELDIWAMRRVRDLLHEIVSSPTTAEVLDTDLRVRAETALEAVGLDPKLRRERVAAMFEEL